MAGGRSHEAKRMLHLFIQRALPFGIHRESHAKKERDNSIVIKIIKYIKYIYIELLIHFDFNEHQNCSQIIIIVLCAMYSKCSCEFK